QAGQRTLAQARSDAEALCDAIEKHATKPADALFAPTLTLYSVRWQALPAGIDAAILQRGQQALDRCQQALSDHQREAARLAAVHAAEAARERELEAERLAQQQAALEQAALEADEQAAADQAREAQSRAEADAISEQQAAEAQAHANI